MKAQIAKKEVLVLKRHSIAKVIEDLVPLHDVAIAVDLPENIIKVYSGPDGEALSF